jgi:hypothetical protein
MLDLPLPMKPTSTIFSRQGGGASDGMAQKKRSAPLRAMFKSLGLVRA